MTSKLSCVSEKKCKTFKPYDQLHVYDILFASEHKMSNTLRMKSYWPLNRIRKELTPFLQLRWLYIIINVIRTKEKHKNICIRGSDKELCMWYSRRQVVMMFQTWASPLEKPQYFISHFEQEIVDRWSTRIPPAPTAKIWMTWVTLTFDLLTWKWYMTHVPSSCSWVVFVLHMNMIHEIGNEPHSGHSRWDRRTDGWTDGWTEGNQYTTHPPQTMLCMIM